MVYLQMHHPVWYALIMRPLIIFLISAVAFKCCIWKKNALLHCICFLYYAKFWKAAGLLLSFFPRQLSAMSLIIIYIAYAFLMWFFMWHFNFCLIINMIFFYCLLQELEWYWWQLVVLPGVWLLPVDHHVLAWAPAWIWADAVADLAAEVEEHRMVCCIQNFSIDHHRPHIRPACRNIVWGK